jgi:hypothetical protein
LKLAQANSSRDLSRKYPTQNWAGGVAQGVIPEFKSKYWEEREGEREGRERGRGGSWTLVAHTVILATWEAEIGRIKVLGQPKQTVHKTPSSK